MKWRREERHRAQQVEIEGEWRGVKIGDRELEEEEQRSTVRFAADHHEKWYHTMEATLRVIRFYYTVMISQVAIATIVSWQVSYLGILLGEALNPGPTHDDTTNYEAMQFDTWRVIQSGKAEAGPHRTRIRAPNHFH